MTTEYRVRKVAHADPADVESELTAAAADGFDFDGPVSVGGDLVLLFSKVSHEPEASPSDPAGGGGDADQGAPTG